MCRAEQREEESLGVGASVSTHILSAVLHFCCFFFCFWGDTANGGGWEPPLFNAKQKKTTKQEENRNNFANIVCASSLCVSLNL